MKFFLLVAITLICCAGRAEEPAVQFNRDIRPILSQNCFACHGPDAKQRKAGLRLDQPESALALLKSGHPALVPGKKDQSALFQRVTTGDPAELMPPPASKKTLTEEQKALLGRWIEEGAEYQPHWAFVPPQPQSPPQVKAAGWAKTAVDNFILQKLEEKNLPPNPEADRRTLIRRASLDLLGLPPSPEEVEAFVADPAPDAYEQLVDRLLDNPHFGERWARHWLDVARFAESHGYEQDYDRPYAFHYRDFVTKAFNADLPYNEFVRWQIAGDEVAPGNPLALAATGFLGAGTHATQITASQVEKERYDELDDMARTTALSFLALTLGCARCHDHKYDPVPTEEYYRLASTFTRTVRADLDIDVDPETYRQALQQFEAEHAPYAQALSAREAALQPAFEQWLSEPTAPAPAPDWIRLSFAETNSENEGAFSLQDDGSYFVSGRHGNQDAYTLTTTSSEGVSPSSSPAEIPALRLDVMRDARLINGGPGRAEDGTFALSKVSARILPASGDTRSLSFSQAALEDGVAVDGLFDDDNATGWEGKAEPQRLLLSLQEPMRLAAGEKLEISLQFKMRNVHALGRFKFALATNGRAKLPLSRLEASAETLPALEARTAGQALSLAQRDTLFAYYRQLDPEWQALNEKAEAHLAQAPLPKLARMMVCSEGVPAIRTHTQGGDFLEQTHLLMRGDPNMKGDVVTQGFVHALMRAPESHWQQPAPQGSNTSFQRTALANWMTDYDQGAGFLLARVIVNRLWQHHLGRGIVDTPSDFGLQGSMPTHPELLDYLAEQLVANGWRLKPIHKLMMTSAVYRQSSAIDPEKAQVDLPNSLWWRFPARRLEAEAIRDSMLSVSGALDDTMFGPGTLDPEHTRRSLYFMIKRSKLVPMMMLFDAPDTTQSLANRAATTIAPQALLLMNNGQVRGWCEKFAERLEREAGEDAASQIDRGYALALGRAPAATELEQAQAFLKQQADSYAEAAQTNATHLAMVDFCQVLFSLNEFVYLD